METGLGIEFQPTRPIPKDNPFTGDLEHPSSRNCKNSVYGSDIIILVSSGSRVSRYPPSF